MNSKRIQRDTNQDMAKQLNKEIQTLKKILKNSVSHFKKLNGKSHQSCRRQNIRVQR